MRKLTVTRKRSSARLLDVCCLYIENEAGGEYRMGDMRCSLIGSVKNGETKAFRIEGVKRRLFALWDSYVDEFNSVLLPDGEEDVTLVGHYEKGVLIFDGAENYSVGNTGDMPLWQIFKRKYLKRVLIFLGVTLLALVGALFYN